LAGEADLSFFFVPIITIYNLDASLHRSRSIQSARRESKSDARPFPPPWSSEEHSAYFVVRDHNGQALAYIYYENELRPAISRKLLTKDEARRIAANIAKLPELLSKS